jgi:predicted nucleic acid-binding protein
MKAVVDNTVLSNFAVIHGETLLNHIFSGELYTTEEVLHELQIGEQRKSIPERDWSWIQRVRLEREQEQVTFMRLKQRFGIGESACLSVAIHHSFQILTDDLDVRKYAQRCGLPVSGTIGVLVLGVKRSILSLEEGNRLLTQMIQQGYYSPFSSLDSLLSE